MKNLNLFQYNSIDLFPGLEECLNIVSEANLDCSNDWDNTNLDILLDCMNNETLF